MAILIDERKRVLVQGITGRDGQNVDGAIGAILADLGMNPAVSTASS